MKRARPQADEKVELANDDVKIIEPEGQIKVYEKGVESKSFEFKPVAVNGAAQNGTNGTNEVNHQFGSFEVVKGVEPETKGNFNVNTRM